MRRSIAACCFCVSGWLAAAPALAVQSCELNGERVNPNNGSSTAGKTGLMRCREGEGGPLLREQELQNGVFMGVSRTFRDGVLEHDYRINAKGNRDGVQRDFESVVGAGKPVLVREETQRDGRTVGLARNWYTTGVLRRVGFHGDDEREQAVAEFNEQGQLSQLRCGPRAVLGNDADDGRWCGHAGRPETVVLYGGRGRPTARVLYERGERRKFESLWDDGSVRELQESGASAGVERRFAADGTKRREVQWVTQDVPGRAAGDRPRRVVTLEQEFHESGKLVQEKRWQPGERGGELVSEQHWYLNGQPKDRTEFFSEGGKAMRRETSFHDNGRKASEGVWTLASIRERRGEVVTGVHRGWDADGRLRFERSYDEKGRVSRERELDAAGTVVRDDEVFEDGSRKAFGK